MADSDAATRKRRDEWKRLAEAATEGPWFEASREFDDDNIWIWAEDPDGGAPFEVALGALPSDQADQDYDNAAFIAAARTAVPDLIAQVEALESERSVLAAKIEKLEAELTEERRKFQTETLRTSRIFDALDHWRFIADQPDWSSDPHAVLRNCIAEARTAGDHLAPFGPGHESGQCSFRALAATEETGGSIHE